MASFKPSVLVLLLIATLIAALPSGLGQEENPLSELEPQPTWETTIGNLEQCWLSVEEVVGCYAEVYRAFVSGKLGITIGPSCCLAINDITSNCWGRMFPNTPSFPPLLQKYCSRYQVGQAEAPSPSPSMEPADV